MNKFKNLVTVIALALLGIYTSSAKALTSFYDRDSQKLVIEGVNLDQNFTLFVRFKVKSDGIVPQTDLG